MGKPKLMIATPCNKSFPYEYVNSLTATWLWANDKYELGVCFVDSPIVHSNRNELLTIAYRGKVDYVLFVDSDMDWRPEVIDEMVKFDKDVVTGVCLSRKPVMDKTHFPALFTKVGNEYRCMGELPVEPFKVDACGSAFMLLNRNVIEKVTEMIPELGVPFDPVSSTSIGIKQIGNSGLVGEDLSFCYRLGKAGFEIWCLPDVKIGHLISFSLGKG